MISLLAAENPMDHVLPHTIFHLGPLVVNNQMLMALVAAILMVLIFPGLFSKAYSDAPTGARNFFESILEFLRIEVFRPALKQHTDRFVPFLWTVFFFILFCNLLGAIPIGALLTLITRKESHLGGTATGNVNTTAVLAVTAFFFIHLNGIWQVARSLMDGTYGHHDHHGKHGHEDAAELDHMRAEGLPADVPNKFQAIGDPTHHYADGEHPNKHGDDGHGDSHAGPHKPLANAILLAVPLYFWNFAPHPFKPGPNEPKTKWLADIPLWGLLLVLELMGALIKPVSLCIRLFANMIAGHIVLAVIVGLIVGVPTLLGQVGVGIPLLVLSLLISILELFVAFLQAYIFTFLTTLFIASAVSPSH